jgi:AcrR family transcriptional regulator
MPPETDYSPARARFDAFRDMPTDVNHPSKRREIAAKAAGVFDSGGYHETNMQTVAQVVGLKKPTLYHYFSGKREILFWIHDEFIDLLIVSQEARRAQHLSCDDSLRGAMRDVLGLMDTHHGHVRTFFEHHRELSSGDRATIAAKRDRYTAMIEEEIVRGIDSGVFRAVDPRLTTLALFGMCNWAYQWYRPDGSHTSREIADFFHDLLLEGIERRD